ncbi:MAG: hypothetical protein ABI890_16715, partial [Lapillicoccus sp.]
AFKEYSQAAVLQMLVDALPRVAKELAAPMGAIDKLTVISTEGAGALPKMVVNNLGQLQQLVKDMVGVDIASMITGFTEGAMGNAPSASPKKLPPTGAPSITRPTPPTPRDGDSA